MVEEPSPDYGMAALPKRHFACIFADVPWAYKAWSKPKDGDTSRRDPERHYDTMSLAEIAALPVRDLAVKSAHLFFCITGPFLAIGAHIPIMKAWGFTPTTIVFTWAKLRKNYEPDQIRFLPAIDSDFHVGLGKTTLKNTEFVVLGRRGSPRRNAKNVRELVLAPVSDHSRKPEDLFERIERYCDGPRLELFGRRSRSGWTVWGKEATKFDATPQASASPATPSLP